MIFMEQTLIILLHLIVPLILCPVISDANRHKTWGQTWKQILASGVVHYRALSVCLES